MKIDFAPILGSKRLSGGSPDDVDRVDRWPVTNRFAAKAYTIIYTTSAGSKHCENQLTAQHVGFRRQATFERDLVSFDGGKRERRVK